VVGVQPQHTALRYGQRCSRMVRSCSSSSTEPGLWSACMHAGHVCVVEGEERGIIVSE
jgi:hypothetical protein